MKTSTIVGITAAVLGVVAIGTYAYDDEEKKRCKAAGGTWDGLLKGCVCPSGTTMLDGKCTGAPGPVTTTPPSPDTVTVSGVQVTGSNDWTADIDWTAVSTATAGYKILVDGVQVGTAPAGTTSGTINGTGVAMKHSASVEACN